ncbi:2-oxoglutarate dehydrogenase complex dihydrolipoyllysine-residue succinyltransferase [Escherichia albertii]|uniref:2-oxoglutarate dehydrogenase complex dihydrolipoyllysine-residue succinyltransferase n=1 Tax=Escherichia albertii TaxID=208962 RepID=UPI001374FA67|nr:2-oxoglutarate dehydrogenase complex dihydrolipoyllysine-residue succinyltransferase [Escherichia albertii]MCZ8622933.1 2-oxoglutarate dehydrogenase complex dihydrolipoyllysine-residue succinyltransferase [Escherichia albertii]MCZ8764195.1 2-oxoglutarate dehydrogenase complex dihydrolipoyllysine-residue succinyltransferase [Escherichia albertii]MCZ8890458.1 2-oxoglutarate dehydrogenase complex dihydrolipoyllysine-residue succinyltransferase [Escherichia albertii]
MIEITVPVLPESVTEGTLSAWCKQEGEHVKRDEVIAELETDKVILEIPAPQDGVLSNIIVSEGSTVTSAQLLAHLKPQAAKEETVIHAVETPVMPAARLEAQRSGVELSDVAGSGRNGRILKEDVLRFTPAPVLQTGAVAEIPPARPLTPGARLERREPMSRLLASQQNNAILTTFNEVNMQSVMDLRARWKDRFVEKHGVKLGFMSFFVKAVTRALERFPVVNASVDGNDIIWRDYCDIGIAVSSNRGLVVPVLRNAQSLSLVEIERQIAEYATLARSGKLPLEALQGGTFSITNGGTFGSMMSTPIINPPQSAILGMHAITPRPVAENGQVVIRPMMYLALSYDHRIIDGQEAVQTLVAIRELLESPEQLLLDL